MSPLHLTNIAKRSLFAPLLLLLTACNAPMSAPPTVSADEIAVEEKAQRAMLSKLAETGGAPRPWRKNQMKRSRFDRVAGRIEKAGAEVCQGLGIPQFDMRCYFYFKTATGDQINAFADGDRIVVYSGMRRFVNNDDELALVLAHEYAHNVMGHIAALENNALAGLLIGAAIEGSTGARGAARDSAYVASITYSPEFEREADYIGMYVLARAGYDPTRAQEFWRRLTSEYPQGVYATVTHPSNPERFAMLNKTVAEIAQKRTSKQPLLPNMSQAFNEAVKAKQ